uniref:Uncharacterized protein n=1 Tax=Rhizophora mucronata TaxID=61149 RepID=A0A2P2QYC0_RHIMU
MCGQCMGRTILGHAGPTHGLLDLQAVAMFYMSIYGIIHIGVSSRKKY